jgi:hypothetical protein
MECLLFAKTYSIYLSLLTTALPTQPEVNSSASGIVDETGALVDGKAQSGRWPPSLPARQFSRKPTLVWIDQINGEESVKKTSLYE